MPSTAKARPFARLLTTEDVQDLHDSDRWPFTRQLHHEWRQQVAANEAGRAHVQDVPVESRTSLHQPYEQRQLDPVSRQALIDLADLEAERFKVTI